MITLHIVHADDIGRIPQDSSHYQAGCDSCRSVARLTTHDDSYPIEDLRRDVTEWKQLFRPAFPIAVVSGNGTLVQLDESDE